MAIIEDLEAKAKGTAEQANEIAAEQRERRHLVVAAIDDLTQPWRTMEAVAESHVSSRDPVTAACLRQWLQADYRWMSRISSLGITVPWDWDARIEMCQQMRERDGMNLLYCLLRRTYGRTRETQHGARGGATQFPMANRFDDAGYMATTSRCPQSGRATG